MSYRLNQREYYEDKFDLDLQYYDETVGGFVYEFITPELDNYVNVLEYNDENSINVYYFDTLGQMVFLDASHYEVDISSREITILNDGNDLVGNYGIIPDFYVSFVPDSIDVEFSSYRFSYDPNPDLKITSTLNVSYWDVIGVDGLDVIPNLDAFYFLNEEETTLSETVSHATQIAAYLSEGDELEFNIEGELGGFDQSIVTAIHAGTYLSLYLDTNIKNIESLKLLSIELYGESGLMSTQIGRAHV